MSTHTCVLERVTGMGGGYPRDLLSTCPTSNTAAVLSAAVLQCLSAAVLQYCSNQDKTSSVVLFPYFYFLYKKLKEVKDSMTVGKRGPQYRAHMVCKMDFKSPTHFPFFYIVQIQIKFPYCEYFILTCLLIVCNEYSVMSFLRSLV